MIEQNQTSLKGGTPPLEEIKFSSLAKRWTVVILVALMILFLLHVWEALPPFIWAIVTAFVFNGPLKALSNRFGGPRWVWAVGIYLIFFAVLGAALVWLIPAITKEAKVLSNDIPIIRANVDDYLDKNTTVNLVGIEIASETARNSINSVLDRLPDIARELGPGLLSKTFRFVIDFLLYIIATFYFMLMGGRAIWGFINTLPLLYRGEIRNLVVRMNIVLGAYIKGQILLVLIMSVASFITLTVLGIRYSLLLGIMVGVLELVPFVGPYLAITICSVVAFFQPKGNFGLSGALLVILVVVLLFILRQLEDYLVIPNIIGRIVELPPLLVIFSIITGAALLGPMGLLLAVPIVAVVKIVVGYLYYKLVDADRQKLFVPADTNFESLFKTLNDYPPMSRLLIVTDPQAEYLHDPTALEQIRELGMRKPLDMAFYCGKEGDAAEKTAHHLRGMGFAIITMEQEHFLSNSNS